VVSATDPPGRILGFLDRSRYYFFQVAPQLYSRVLTRLSGGNAPQNVMGTICGVRGSAASLVRHLKTRRNRSGVLAERSFKQRC
jgi:hypothetical protein